MGITKDFANVGRIGKFQMTPINNQIVIKPFYKEVKTQTEGGIHLAPQSVEQERAKDKSTEGEVIFVHEESKLTPGQKVIFEKVAPTTPLILDGVDHIIINEKHIVLVR